MSLTVDRERAEARAGDALAWMAKRGIPPIPENFELVYGYFGGEEVELKRSVDLLVEKGCKFEPGVMANLYQRYFRRLQDAEVIAGVGENITEELNSVLQILASASRDQSDFGHTLSAASGELDGTRSGETAIKGVIDRLINATRSMEIRSKQLEQQLQCSSREISDLQERLESVRQEALTDQLTGIDNRRSFDLKLKAAIEQTVDTGEPLCLVMYDIDDFKQFNDTWGHQTGDHVLRLVGSVLTENVKGRDAAARYGGEEFAVILPQTTLLDATQLAENIRHRIWSKKVVKKTTGEILGVVTISAGVAQFRSDEDAEGLVRRADALLYAAKRGGRNRVVSETDAESLRASA